MSFGISKARLLVRSAAAFVLACGFLAAPVAEALAADPASVARGGRLYDKWWSENKASKPEETHPSYSGKNYKGDTTWRCKECHGWDGLGKDGAYGEGAKRFTGIKGIAGASGKDPAEIAAVLRDKTHGYTDAMLTDKDVTDLANFVSAGQVDMTKYIEYPSLKAKGDAAKGKTYFETMCAGCHGNDGKKIADADPIGAVAANGPEMMMKVLNGQPKEPMPALLALDHQITGDIVAHLQTLPQ